MNNDYEFVTASGEHVILLHRHPDFRKDHLQHNIPIGQVVILTMEEGDQWFEGDIRRVDGKEICTGLQGKARLIVVGHSRDCDGEPLYILSTKPIGYELLTDYDAENKRPIYAMVDGVRRSNLDQSLRYGRWVKFWTHGWSESSLTPTEDFVPMKWKNVYEYEKELAGY